LRHLEYLVDNSQISIWPTDAMYYVCDAAAIKVIAIENIVAFFVHVLYRKSSHRGQSSLKHWIDMIYWPFLAVTS
jgi:hypothetical protein